MKRAKKILTFIPARLDRLRWSRFHWLVIFALGVTWILDGLEVTLTGTISGVLQDAGTLHLTGVEIGLLGSAYVAGAVAGALIFGYLTDLFGRKRLFFITLAVYIIGVLLSSLSWDITSFAIFRFITGAGIGGEYAAINSAVDELIPARIRGRIDLIINGTYWVGAAIGSLSTIWLLNPQIFPVDKGWRLGFAIGGALGLLVLFLRRFVPESPRWLMLRGRIKEAESIVSKIEKESPQNLPHNLCAIEIAPQKATSLKVVFHTMFTKYRSRSILGLSLMTAQAFLFNAIFFTYALILTKFYGVPGATAGLYILPFTIGNFLGPIMLGHFFDSVGRRKMITLTYATSGILLALTGYLFSQGFLNATTQTLLWCIIFYFASAAASSAYLTVSEIFPLETRGLAIALFYSVGTGIGGILAPWVFGSLISTGSRTAIFYGYLLASLLMILAAVVEWLLGIDAENKSLEEIAPPLKATPSYPKSRKASGMILLNK